MGWLDTILSVATAGASVYSASQLQSMRSQGAEAALIQAMVMTPARADLQIQAGSRRCTDLRSEVSKDHGGRPQYR